MGDDIVHLPGDAHALGVGGQPGLGFAFAFEEPVAFPDAFDLASPAVDDPAQQPGDEHDRRAQSHDRGQEQILSGHQGP